MICKDRIWSHQDASLPVSFQKTCTQLRTNQCSWYKDLRKTPRMGGRVACDESEVCFFRFGPNEMWWFFLNFLKVCWACYVPLFWDPARYFATTCHAQSTTVVIKSSNGVCSAFYDWSVWRRTSFNALVQPKLKSLHVQDRWNAVSWGPNKGFLAHFGGRFWKVWGNGKGGCRFSLIQMLFQGYYLDTPKPHDQARQLGLERLKWIALILSQDLCCSNQSNCDSLSLKPQTSHVLDFLDLSR